MASRTLSTRQAPTKDLPVKSVPGGTGPGRTKPTGRLLRSRAVSRPIEAGNSAMCAVCDAPVKFVARMRANQVIANVYERGVWNRVEHYHLECYHVAGEPYGSAA